MLTMVQFTIVLDFTVLAPLGAQLMRELHITAAQFSILVSAYAVSAGAAGFLLAGISDSFDRKKLLLFMYAGFIIGTFLCAIAHTYHFLIMARITAGIFGGVMSGISFAIVTDVFDFNVRATVMGFIQMAFSASQILGIPLGLFFAQKWSWNVPFHFIAGLGIVNALLFWQFVRPIDAHLQHRRSASMLRNIVAIVSNRKYIRAFLTTFFLATGGFMLMPFSSPFLVYNVGIDEAHLAFVFLSAGMGTFIFGPIFGRLSDLFGKFKIFAVGSMASAVLVYFYTHLGQQPLPVVIALYTLLMVAVSSRMSSSVALISAVPDPSQRGAFMNINSSVQQVSGGIATLIAGRVLLQNADKSFANFSTLGYITIATLLICVALMHNINKIISFKK